MGKDGVSSTVAVALASCGGPINPTPNLPPTPVPARTTWGLGYRVVESEAVMITGQSIGCDEGT